MQQAQRTLFHPFETGILEWPGSGNWLAAGFDATCIIPQGCRAKISFIQGFKPDHDALSARGYHVLRDWSEAEKHLHDGAFLLLGRHRGQNKEWFRQLYARLRPGALMVVAGGKTEGVQSFARRLKSNFSQLETLAKYHGMVMWLCRSDENVDAGFQPDRQKLIDRRFHVAPGMFSHDHVDQGSRLLAQLLPSDISGLVADFCAGWGYLSTMVTERCSQVKGLELFEADWDSLQAARKNLESCPLETAYHWIDLSNEPVKRRFDAIVMNPPFHRGRGAEPAIGQAMIRRAADALNRNGRLYMVANRQLPYEETLSGLFSHVEKKAENRTFKVLFARR